MSASHHKSLSMSGLVAYRILIFFLAFLLGAIGICEIYSASFRVGGDFASKQLFWFFIGIAVYFLAIWIGYRYFLDLSYLFYVLSIFMLIWVLVFGEARSGAQRWLTIGSLQIQPSEFCKIATILMLANFLASRSAQMAQKRSFFAAICFVGVPAVLVLKQPDLGSALVLIPILFALVFFWGVKIRYLVTLFFGALATLPFLWHGLKPYQQKRLLVFLDPSIDPIGASYTAIQSKIAVGSGGLFGKGWLQGTQTQLDFVPEHHTDFIFSVFAEEFGFLGALFLILLFALLVTYAFQVMLHTTDSRARLLALGIASYFSFQAVVNIAMTFGFAPITGIPLPFISYGGSSLVVNFFAFGILSSIYRERSIF
ncbi:MAG: rod shape-determining protein RodA [Candidatus Omnitrophica bacterium]|nr:rod shape-determining protein RodA [Candidatus Omnitrophota bacterium]